MGLLFVAKPVEGWSSMASIPLPIITEIVRGFLVKPKEEKPKEQPKDEKSDSKPEGKRSGGYVKSADGCAIRGKTKGKMV
jgi:hypothetical protein